MENAAPLVLDPAGTDIQGEIARIRARGPVTLIEIPGGVRAWSVTDAALLKEILSSPLVSKDPRQHWPAFQNGEISDDFLFINWVNTPSMFTAYGSEHRRLRKFVAPAFTHKRTIPWESRIQALTEGLLRHLDAVPAGETVDLREEFAYPLPIQVLSELMGVPKTLAEPLRTCVDGVFDTTMTKEQSVANYLRMIELLGELVAYRRSNPGDDMTSTLIASADDPEQSFTEEELIGTLYLTINAGHETTVNLLVQAAYLILVNPQQREAVRNSTVSWTDVIEEVLRFEAPAAHIPLRYAVQDFELGGVEIAAGDPILACYAGAGRDPKVHGATADAFDPARANKEHLSFGHGAHHCLGAPLARMEVQVALPALFARYPEMQLAISPDDLGVVPGLIANGPSHLPVTLSRK